MQYKLTLQCNKCTQVLDSIKLGDDAFDKYGTLVNEPDIRSFPDHRLYCRSEDVYVEVDCIDARDAKQLAKEYGVTILSANYLSNVTEFKLFGPHDRVLELLNRWGYSYADGYEWEPKMNASGEIWLHMKETK